MTSEGNHLVLNLAGERYAATNHGLPYLQVAELESELWHWREYFSIDDGEPSLLLELQAAHQELAAFRSLARQHGWDPQGGLDVEEA